MQEKLTDLQSKILAALADDYEDVEQLYLSVNHDVDKQFETNLDHRWILLSMRFHLRDVMDEIASLLRKGFIFAKYSNNEAVVPLDKVNITVLHQYWFGVTEQGKRLRKANHK